MVLINPPTQASFTLQQGVVDVWFADLAHLNLNRIQCYSLLDGTERSVAAGLQFESLRETYVHGHGLLRALLGAYLQVSAQSLNIHRTVQGKPFLADFPALSFNLSHSNSKWLLAVTKFAPIGVDIEAMKPRAHLAGLVARCFAPEERAYWDSLPEAAKLPSFFDFWTRKEAFVKAVGKGIALGLDRCVMDPVNPQHFLRVPAECGCAGSWGVKDLVVDGACRAAVVVQLPIFQAQVFEVTEGLLEIVKDAGKTQ